MAELSQKELEQAVASLSNHSLSAFITALEPDYTSLPYQELIVRELEAVERGECKRLIITMPPQHGKSLHSSIYLPSWFLGRNPNKKIIMSSYSGEVAARFGRRVRNIMQHPMYSKMFPGVQLMDDSRAADRFETNHGGYYIASGRDGSITSFSADLLILDDLFANKIEGDSELIRSRVWEAWTSVYSTRLHNDSAVVMLMTRWHEDDLIGRLLALEPNKWRVLSLPAIAEADETFRQSGEPLWPIRYPLEYLAGLRKLDPVTYECMYQCNPIAEGTAEFKREWFRYYDTTPQNLRVTMTVDPAIGKKQENDESAISVVGIDNINNKYVLEVAHARLNPSELIDQIFLLAKKWQPKEIGVETVAYQQALSHFLSLEMKNRNQFYSVREIRSHTNKEERIRGLIPHYSSGSVFHSRDMAYLESQLLRFPRGMHDDVIDSLAMQCQMWAIVLDIEKYKQNHEAYMRERLVGQTPLTNIQRLDRQMRPDTAKQWPTQAYLDYRARMEKIGR